MRPSRAPNLLLVEGKDELRALPELMEQSGVAWPRGKVPVDIHEHVGIENLLQPALLSTHWKTAGRAALGMIIDADESADQQWERLRGLVSQAALGVDMPARLPAGGFIHKHADGRRLGFWVMPPADAEKAHPAWTATEGVD